MTPERAAVLADMLREEGLEDFALWLRHPEALRQALRNQFNMDRGQAFQENWERDRDGASYHYATPARLNELFRRVYANPNAPSGQAFLIQNIGPARGDE